MQKLIVTLAASAMAILAAASFADRAFAFPIFGPPLVVPLYRVPIHGDELPEPRPSYKLFDVVGPTGSATVAETMWPTIS